MIRGGALLLAAPAILVTLNCYHPSSYGGLRPIDADSTTGIVSITGTAFEQQIVLRSTDATELLSAHAGDSAALSRLGGVEVAVVGRRTEKAFHVRSFTAVSVAGAPVVDGILRSDGTRILLETTNGTTPLGNPPPQLKNLIAARVWIGGPLATGPNSFGIIVPAPQQRR